jgi:hypothetical protein
MHPGHLKLIHGLITLQKCIPHPGYICLMLNGNFCGIVKTLVTCLQLVVARFFICSSIFSFYFVCSAFKWQMDTYKTSSEGLFPRIFCQWLTDTTMNVHSNGNIFQYWIKFHWDLLHRIHEWMTCQGCTLVANVWNEGSFEKDACTSSSWKEIDCSVH